MVYLSRVFMLGAVKRALVHIRGPICKLIVLRYNIYTCLALQNRVLKKVFFLLFEQLGVEYAYMYHLERFFTLEN